MESQVSAAERAELHKTIWNVANELRGSVDGWDFKAYVLGFLFYRFLSENITDYINRSQHEVGDTSFDYAQLSDAEAESARCTLVDEKGFFILPSQLFQNVRKNARSNPDLNETLGRVFAEIEGSALGHESEDDFKGLFSDMDVNSNKLGVSVQARNEKLTRLMEAIEALPLRDSFKRNSNDLFGDAYEFLMTMYASSAGKSGGEFFTPQHVSEVLARIAIGDKQRVRKAYDPAAGSGSLLLQVAKVLGLENVDGFFGQEINLTTFNLARMNMFLHDVGFEKFDIAHGDTLLDPHHWDDEPFDVIVSNPPYSIRWDGDNNPLLINDERFAPAGVLAPKSKADLAFVMHMLAWLAEHGTAAIVEFPGVLYRGGAEAKIRKYLLENNFIDAVVQLPADLFFGTSIGTCIIVLKRSKASNDVLFVDASELFERSGNKNLLNADHRDRIVETVLGRVEEEFFSVRVPNERLLENDCNLSVSAYVEKEDTREQVDIVALNQRIAGIVARQQELRLSIDQIVAVLEGAK